MAPKNVLYFVLCGKKYKISVYFFTSDIEPKDTNQERCCHRQTFGQEDNLCERGNDEGHVASLSAVEEHRGLEQRLRSHGGRAQYIIYHTQPIRLSQLVKKIVTK